MSYRNKLSSSSNILKDFEILEENRILDTFISYTVRSNTNPHSKFNLTRETVEKSPETLARIEALIKSKEIGLIQAQSITLEQANTMLMVYTLTQYPQKQPSLHSLLLSDRLSSSQKLNIFKNLCNTICSLHDLGVAYLELCPENILIESKSMVYLLPFKIFPDVYNEEYYYSAPEMLSGISYFNTLLSGDIWSLGCIYAELFLSLTPLFQAPSIEEKIMKMFQVLGIPNFQDVESYMAWESYIEYKEMASGCKENLQKMIFSGVPLREKEMIMAMLSFSIDKRVDIRDVAVFPWHEEDELIDNAEEYKTSFINDKSRISESAVDPIFTNTSNFCSDNTLIITLKSAMNLELFKYCAEDYYLVFSYELDGGVAVHSATSPVIKAGISVNINFTKEFLVNSQELKKKYRTNPFIIKVTQCLNNGEKRREDILGACEAYFGLLFSNGEGNEVQGWYNITSGKGILGQVLLEVKTKSPIKQVEYGLRGSGIKDEIVNDRTLIKDISVNLGNLTAQLLDREDSKQKKEQEDLQFAETLKKLRKLLLDKS